jgi:hypothetical protein
MLWTRNAHQSVGARPERVIGILVAYTQEYLSTALSEFVGVLESLSSNVDIIVVVNKELDCSLVSSYCSAVFVRGTNSNAEFSGWDEGLAAARLLISDFALSTAVFVFANDTFCHHGRWSARIRKDSIRRLSRWFANPSTLATGFMDTAPHGFSIMGISFSSWISTFFFALKYPAIQELEWTLSPCAEELNRLIPGSTIDYGRFFGAGMNPLLRDHIISWLFDVSGHCWYKAEPLTAETLPMMRIKARAILSEKILSARMLRGSISIMPLNPVACLRARLVIRARRASLGFFRNTGRF